MRYILCLEWINVYERKQWRVFCVCFDMGWLCADKRRESNQTLDFPFPEIDHRRHCYFVVRVMLVSLLLALNKLHGFMVENLGGSCVGATQAQ